MTDPHLQSKLQGINLVLMAIDAAKQKVKTNYDNLMLSNNEIRQMKKYGMATDDELKKIANSLLQLAIILTE